MGSLINALPGAVSQGLVWGIMALGVYVTYRILDVADLTVDGSLATGGAVCVMLIRAGVNPWVAILAALVAGGVAGLVTALLHTKCGIPAILAGILTQLALYSVNLRVMGGKSNQPVSVDKYNLIVSQRYVRELKLTNPMIPFLIILAAIIGILYWFFGTEKGFFEYGRTTDTSSGHPFLLSSSSSVINSPKILATFPRFISSIIST